jgi:xanthine dehydrogenase YagR molybdenum-binding subunit
MAAEAKRKRKVMIGTQVEGVEKLVEQEVDEDSTLRWQPREQMKFLGGRLPRVDGPVKAAAAAVYTCDVRLPGMLYGRILGSPHAHARVRSLDLTPALRLPGVRAAMGSVEVYRALMSDKQQRIVDPSELRYEGQPVAAVAAETPEQAEDAIHAIAVEYEVLPHVVRGEDALRPDAPKVFPDGNLEAQEKTGDPSQVAAAFARCAAVVEAEYRTPSLHHCSLEPHAIVVDCRRGTTATAYFSTQSTFFMLADFARELGLSESDVAIDVQHMGGGFGAKWGMGIEGRFAAQLAKKTLRPVRIALDRRSEFLMAGNRTASWQKLKAGVDRDGKLLALEAEQYNLGGLSPGGTDRQPYVYAVESSRAQLFALHTHVNASRAMRAPGSPQSSFAIESMLDELAFRLGMDPVALRKRNLTDPAYHRQLDRGAREIGWERRAHLPTSGVSRRGLGCAVCKWGGWGGPGNVVTIEIARDGSVVAKVGSQDIGTGTRTLVRAIVADELGLPMSAIRELIGNTRLGHATGSGGSSNTASLAPAVKHAALQVRVAVAEHVARLVGAKPEQLTFANSRVRAGDASLSWKQACASLPSSGVSARGEWKPGLSDGMSQGVAFAEVEVDTETGAVRPIKIVHVQDLGFALNRLAVESQIIGGVIQAMGMALWEQRVFDVPLGTTLTASFNDYKVPGALEMPEIVPIIDDGDTREGVMGVGEPPVIATVGALANAVFNACGVRVRELPITPDKILAGLYAKG